jgi:hypothetical protein
MAEFLFRKTNILSPFSLSEKIFYNRSALFWLPSFLLQICNSHWIIRLELWNVGHIYINKVWCDESIINIKLWRAKDISAPPPQCMSSSWLLRSSWTSSPLFSPVLPFNLSHLLSGTSVDGPNYCHYFHTEQHKYTVLVMHTFAFSAFS